MPQYKKVFDIGTYTGNGGQYRVGIPTLRGVGPSGKQVANSLRFRSTDSTSLSRTPGSTGNRKTWTWSGWVKRGAIGSGQNWNTLFSAGSYTGSSTHCSFYASGGKVDIISFYQYTAGYQIFYETTAVYKDTSLWYHVVIAVDTTQATAANRVLIYVNGVQVTSFQTSTAPTQNLDTYMNLSGTAGYIGSTDRTSTDNLNGYLSEVNFIDGQQLSPSSFGEFNSDNIWVPKTYSSTYGTNGYNLKFAGAAGTDSSGNGNNWTPTGFNVTTANTTYDIMTDSPTDYLSGSMTTANNAGNYATWSPLSGDIYTVSGSALSVSGGNLDLIANQNLQWSSNRSNWKIPTSGKWYFEYTLGGAGGGGASYPVQVGVMLASSSIGTPNPFSGQSYAYMYASYDGKFYNNNTTSITGSTWASGDIIGVALDIDNGAIYFSKNGTWQNSGSPTSGASKTGAIFTTSIVGVSFTPCASTAASNSPLSMNCGQRAFAYTPPTGYVGLNTYNYPRPADSSLWFYGDTPDLMWIKNRTTTGLHTITDTVRGMGLNQVTSAAAADTSYPGVTEMNKFGMSIINDSTSILNGSTNSHVYWGWKAGGATVTNTSGTITSQVSANPSAGFSIVSYTLNNSTFTVGHGLSSAPNFILVKNRDTTNNWDVYHSSIGAGYRLVINDTSAQYASTQVWNNTSPTSSVFSGNSAWWSSPSTSRMIAYCWTAISGYSAFGSYTANASTDGPFIYCGFRPRWLLIKRADAIQEWVILDTTRSTYNYTNATLYPNYNNAESASGNYVDINANGFKIRDSGGGVNYGSGGTYIYAAFAEIPFKYARAR
ncbi:hypothetical protein EB001_15775 [bacterium]|nr:hypothetical protein [bacterium]